MDTNASGFEVHDSCYHILSGSDHLAVSSECKQCDQSNRIDQGLNREEKTRIRVVNVMARDSFENCLINCFRLVKPQSIWILHSSLSHPLVYPVLVCSIDVLSLTSQSPFCQVNLRQTLLS